MYVELKDINKTYAGYQASNHVSFGIEQGRLIALLGPSGSGKTTILRMIAGLETPDSGEIVIDGKVVNNIPASERGIGFVFQNYALFPHMTVLDNVLLAPTKVQKRPKAEVQQEAEALLDRVGLLGKKNSYPRELSGGQKQRVAIVRALCMHPEILLFDEVTAALDPEMVREVLDVMLELADSGQTMLIVTHEMQFARAIADQVIMLEDGGIVEQSDDAEAFFTNPKTERAKRFLHTFEFDRHRRPAETPTEPTGTSAE